MYLFINLGLWVMHLYTGIGGQTYCSGGDKHTLVSLEFLVSLSLGLMPAIKLSTQNMVVFVTIHSQPVNEGQTYYIHNH